MLDERKLDLVREYLRTEFRGRTISDWYDSDRMAQVFRIEEGR